MLAAKPAIVNKLVPFKMAKNDFQFFANLKRQKFNIVRANFGGVYNFFFQFQKSKWPI